MTKFKRSLAVILVVLMAFSSVSICAFAADGNVDFSKAPADSSEFNYGITTKFFEKDKGEWVPSDGIVKRGDAVKARVYIETNYFTGSADLVFAYEKAFYSFAYPDTAAMNTAANQPALADYNKVKLYSEAQCANLMNKLKSRALVSDGDMEGYGFVGVAFEHASMEPVVKFGDIDFETAGAWEDKWAFELDFTVKDDADSEKKGETGDLIVLPGTIQSISAQGGFVNLPSAAEGTDAVYTSDAYLWYEQTPVLAGDPQKVIDSVTFFGNGGLFDETDASAEAYGYNGDEVAVADLYGYFGISKPEQSGYTLIGWKEADKDGNVVGSELVEKIAVGGEAKYFAAVWEDAVTTSTVDFYKNDGSGDLFASYSGTIGEPISYSDSRPVREGYAFKGWSVNAENGTPEIVPATYPDTSATYYAVWQLNNYNLQYYIPSDVANYVFETYGPAKSYAYGAALDLLGTPADSFIPDGYEFAGWKLYDSSTHNYTDVPGTMPADNLNVYALCTPKENPVKYYIDGTLLTTIAVVTDGVIPTDDASLFTGYEGPQYDSDYFYGWYTDEKCTEALPAGAVVPAGGISLYAKTAIPANFYKEIGDEEPYDVTYAPFNGTITLPEKNPTKADGSFSGWTPESTVMDNAAGKDFFATWGDIEYTVSYYIGDASTAAHTESVKYGDAFEAWKAPDKEGYSFNGWTWSKEEGGTIDKPGTMPAENLIAKGDYTANKYTITYKVDGSTVNTVQNMTVGTAIADYSYEKTGYQTITQWNWSYTDKEGNTVKLAAAPVTMPAYNLVAEADSSAKVYTLTITYTGAGAATPSTYSDRVAYNSTYSVNSPAVTGYTASPLVISGTMPNRDVNETVTYTPNNYTVSYEVDGAPYQTPENYAYGAAVTVKAEPTQTGYTFSGWTWKDANGVTIAEPTTMPAGNIKAVGTFTVNKHDIVYKDDNGTQLAKFEGRDYGSATPTVAEPKKEGYTFNGWTPAFSATVPDNDVEYTATYKINSYKVVYKLDGGNIGGNTVDVEKSADYNAPVPTIENPVKDGYKFNGWGAVIPETMPARNLEFIAQWIPESAGYGDYTVKVYLMGTDGTYAGAPSFSGSGSKEIGTEVKVADFYPVDAAAFTLDSAKTNVVTGTIGASSVDLVAYYKRNTVTIKWNPDGGKIDGQAGTKEVKVYYGAAVVAPTATKDGYTFDGWNKKIASPAAGDAEYTAKWAINKNQVRYQLNGGMIDGSTNDYVFNNVEYGSTIPKPEVPPVKEGYKFEGWDINGDKKVDENDTFPTMPDEIFVAAAVYSAEQYTATFDANGGSFPVGAVTSKQVAFDADITAAGITAPTREGYTFEGWSLNKNATVKDANLGKMDSTNGKMVYAVWSKNNYTITYDAKDGEFADGSSSDVVSYAYGETIVKHEQPSLDGYTFSGWLWYDANGAITEPAAMPAGNLTAVAQYTQRHKAIFYYDYENDKTNISSQSTGDVGDVIPAPTTPAKDGYTFKGWYEIDESGNIGTVQVIDFGKCKYTEADRRFTAKWEVLPGTVTFRANGGKFTDTTEIKNYTENVGAEVSGIVAAKAAELEISREGYEFKGWSTNPAATAADNDLGKVTATGTTFYAVWKAAEHKVTFDANGGKFGQNPTLDKNYNYGSQIEKPATDPTRDGYICKGWAETSTATAALTDLGKMPDTDKVFYAVWAKAYTVKYDPNGGTIDGSANVISKDCEEGSATPTLKDILGKEVYPVKDGYVFDGWDPAVSDKVSGDVTYKAKWRVPAEGEYTVTYKDESGNVIKTVPYKVGDTVPGTEEPTAPAKEGYTFDGWTWSKADGTVIDKPATMPAENLTATAKYKKTESSDDLGIFGLIDPEDFGKFVDDVVNYVAGIKIDIPDFDNKGDKKDDGKNNEGGTDIPNTGSVTGIVVLATISGAAAAAYVFTKKKKDDDNED